MKNSRKKSNKEAMNLIPRNPVVVILGHVDHGKTSILDYIRKTHIAEKEAGGITQHIGAYQIEHQNKIITFIDTPGHEAFSAMRARGAKVADIAVLVVAADEGVKPQTKEAINYIKKSALPTILALSKIDKPEAQPEKVKKELMAENFIVEDLGGKVPAVEVSAKTGQGINDLLDLINLVAEMEELKADVSKPAVGSVIESCLDSQKGPLATLLIRDGILKLKDCLVTQSTFGVVKSMENFNGEKIKEAGPSTPVVILGFNKVPTVGEKFKVESDPVCSAELTKRYLKLKSEKYEKDREVFSIKEGQKVLNIILKTDVRGSIEAVKNALSSLASDKVIFRFLRSEVGDITEDDVKLAHSSQGIIIGFRVKRPSSVNALIERLKVKVKIFELIYELVQAVRLAAMNLLEPEIVRNDLGEVKILAVFKKEKNRIVIGGKVISGRVKRGSLIEVIRNEEKVGQGRLLQLQRNRKDIEEVAKGSECGILFEGNIDIQEGDILKVYEEEKIRQEL